MHADEARGQKRLSSVCKAGWYKRNKDGGHDSVLSPFSSLCPRPTYGVAVLNVDDTATGWYVRAYSLLCFWQPEVRVLQFSSYDVNTSGKEAFCPKPLGVNVPAFGPFSPGGNTIRD
jgi:hypothetical protein